MRRVYLLQPDNMPLKTVMKYGEERDRACEINAAFVARLSPWNSCESCVSDWLLSAAFSCLLTSLPDFAACRRRCWMK